MHRDNNSIEYANDEPYCESCYNEEFFYCHFCDTTKGKDDFIQYFVHTGHGTKSNLCGICKDTGQFYEDRTQRDTFINLDQHSSYFVLNGEPTEVTACRSLPLDVIRSLQGEQAIRLDRNTVQKQLGKSIGAIQSLLINKSRGELEKCPSPKVSPTHNRIYIGLEIEALNGKFFTWTKSKAFKNKTIDMGPHKMLSREMPKGTRMVRDGSIQGNNGQEFLPPIVKKKADWNKIEKVIKALKESEWKTNESCGIHMHFSHALISPENPKLVKEIFRIFYYIEPLLFKCLPANRRNNEYCKPISSFFTETEIKQDIKLDYWYYGNFWKKRIQRANDHNSHPNYVIRDRNGQITEHIRFGGGKFDKENMRIAKEQDHYFVGRYIGCNLHALYQKGTIELRYFPSILEFSYVYTWSRLMAAVFSYALKGGSYELIAKIMSDKVKLEDKIKNLGKLLGWTDATVKFLITEYKTHQEWKTKNKPKIIDPWRDENNIQPQRDSESNQRLRHLEPAIISQDPIPPSPTQEEIFNPSSEERNRTTHSLLSDVANLMDIPIEIRPSDMFLEEAARNQVTFGTARMTIGRDNA